MVLVWGTMVSSMRAGQSGVESSGEADHQVGRAHSEGEATSTGEEEQGREHLARNFAQYVTTQGAHSQHIKTISFLSA